MITGKLYDWLKWIAQVVLPALGTLYFSIASAWGFSDSTHGVVGTIMAVDLFLGVLLGISQVSYNKHIEKAGKMLVDDESGKMLFQIGEEVDLDQLPHKKEIRFSVKNVPGEITNIHTD